MPDPVKPLKPIFYDESRRRWSWVLRFGVGATLIISFLLAIFIISIMALPLLPHNILPRSHDVKDYGNRDPILNDRQIARRQFLLHKEEKRLKKAIDKDKPLAFGPPSPISNHVVVGFYVNWDETSRSSLRRNIDQITHVMPEWLHLTKDGRSFMDARIPEDVADIEPYIRQHQVPIIPVINNYIPSNPNKEDGQWNPQALHLLLTDPARRKLFIANLKTTVLNQKWQGINIDFEQVPEMDRDFLTEFMRELYVSFHSSGLLVTQDISIEDPAFDVVQLALWNDYILPMIYDEHSAGDENGAGSIAGISWTRTQLEKLFSSVPADKVVLAFGNYAYDWQAGDNNAVSLSYQSAVLQAKESQDPENPEVAQIKIDPASLNPFYNYTDDQDKKHTVWMLDATSTYNQWEVARHWEPRGVALWYMGSEDPTVWNIIGRNNIDFDHSSMVDSGGLNKISYGHQSQVDFEGEGELLEVLAEPSDGIRTLKKDSVSDLINYESYQQYPSSYVVRRYGHRNKKVVLTFDDGPDPTWTPKVLDILKEKNVKATFFVIGDLAHSYPGLIAREWDEGNELGNHTYTHPNLALTGSERTLLEISTTQRIIEAITGRTTTLFRPPYAIDVEPRTGNELRSVMLASKKGFISVGEMNDPQDWNLWKHGPNGEVLRRTAADIEESIWHDRDLGNIILMHDSGGDRTQTLIALPRIIDRLRSAGYEFITLAELRGLPRNTMFPPLTGRDVMLVRVDEWVFQSTYWLQTALITLFTLSVILGVSRQLIMAILALIQFRKENKRDLAMQNAEPYTPPVSVIIAAYNEEKVIIKTVETILTSHYPDLEIIVVDDGSKDKTYQVVAEKYADDLRVTCVRKENGGKSSALNRGLQIARGEVIVALDADTLFARDAITRMVRHFRDPSVGAVSGNVRVGNANNILTIWQSLEYITSQNFDRRAYDLLNCITVVPGAVGAWRRSAIEMAGGYTSETLAEDTDLTWKISRAIWRILHDSTALAYTEAPESLRNLSRQRFRWAFGTLQNLWKHRDATFRHGAFGWVAIPSLWLYQILFPAISPIMDLTVIWALVAGNFMHVLGYYLLMIGIEFLGAVLAIWMDKGNWKLLPWLLLQRFVYRQMMYYVILKSLVYAIHGGAVGWNKFERHGTVKMDDRSVK